MSTAPDSFTWWHAWTWFLLGEFEVPEQPHFGERSSSWWSFLSDLYILLRSPSSLHFSGLLCVVGMRWWKVQTEFRAALMFERRPSSLDSVSIAVTISHLCKLMSIFGSLWILVIAPAISVTVAVTISW